MRGIQYIYDNQGNRVKVVVDLRRYEKEFAIFLDQLSRQENSSNASSNGTTNSNPVHGDVITHIGGGSAANARTLKVKALLQTAFSYAGVPYRTGGTTRSGMDCSGFTQTSFKTIGVNLPRVSRDQATVGKSVSANGLQVGDLMFFATGTPGRINHVGIVSDTSNPQGIKFIHASSSRGIMETTMAIDYWKRAYMTSRRVV
ncbi:MAG: NlpC/P60 family protein [Aureispira sp.]|nr:NlpC/P60 family protein [Aureispira sp.]